MTTSTSHDLASEDDPLWEDDGPSTGRSVLEWVAVVAGAVLVALLIKTFVVQAFYIPSESMMPTLQGGGNTPGDRVLVNKLSYRLHDINRGDIVVFERPAAPAGSGAEEEITDLIKRVIGLPGETVVFRDGGVEVNGQRLVEPYLPASTRTDPAPSLTAAWGHSCTADDPCRVPGDSLWVMGDNRTNSSDSRYLGPIQRDLVVGRAFVIVWPITRHAIL